VAVKDLCRKHDFSDASYYLWHRKYGGMEISDAKRLKAARSEEKGREELSSRGSAGNPYKVGPFARNRAGSFREIVQSRSGDISSPKLRGPPNCPECSK
jgi:hypothetical protein